MTSAILLGTLLGVALLLLVTAQPVGAPRPSLAARLEQLHPEHDHRAAVVKPAFRVTILERTLRPLVDEAGRSLLALARRLGLDLRATQAQLRAVGDAGDLTLFLGQKVATALIVLAVVPMASSLGALPTPPAWLWLGSGLVSFFAPDAILHGTAERRRRELRDGLARFADLVSLSVSAGVGLEMALEEAARHHPGPFFTELRRALRDTRLQRQRPHIALERLAAELGLAEAQPLASSLAAAQAQGVPVSQVLRAQARSIRERRRLEFLEASERAQVHMYLPVGLLMLPAFLVVVFYPAAVQLLQVTAR